MYEDGVVTNGILLCMSSSIEIAELDHTHTQCSDLTKHWIFP